MLTFVYNEILMKFRSYILKAKNFVLCFFWESCEQRENPFVKSIHVLAQETTKGF